MATIKDLLNNLQEFKASPENAGYDLRLDLADIILRHVDGQKMTQKQLAEAAKMKESFITRIVHADSNCTFDVAGRILTALGVRVKLSEVKEPRVVESVMPPKIRLNQSRARSSPATSIRGNGKNHRRAS